MLHNRAGTTLTTWQTHDGENPMNLGTVSEERVLPLREALPAAKVMRLTKCSSISKNFLRPVILTKKN
jgi:hypothetical protein